MEVRTNDILKNLNTNEIERILWIDAEQGKCYCIQMGINKLNINVKLLEDINNGFEEGAYTIIPNDDYVILFEENLNENRKEKLENSYNIVNMIDNLENIPFCFVRKYRGKFVKQAMDKYDVSEKCIYKYLRKYWQGGRTKDALFDKYNNCGRCVDKTYTKKPGRKGVAGSMMGDNIGIVIDENVKKVFQDGIDRYYRNNDKITLAKTFRNIKRDYYSDKLWYEKPTIYQFYNWYKKSIDKDKMEKDRKGKKNYQNNVKPIKSDTVYDGFNPGLRYQVDSTIFPIYLVNRIDRSLGIGRPILYISADCFSTKITGMHIGLEQDSWSGYASLLYNTIQPKENYCRYYGIEENIEELNVDGSPQIIMGDRGGFLTKNSDMLVKYLKISTEYAPTFEGQAKGTVEQKFNIIENMIKSDLPGIIMTKYRERGKKDYRKDAKLDLYEFTQIVIEAVLERNAMIMKDYPLEKELVWAGVKPSANEIWNWGIKNKKGLLRKEPEDKLRFYLLRHENASITEKGIKFKNMLYTCKLAEEELWFSRLNKNRKIEIAFDSNCMNEILIYHKSTNKYIQCKINRKMTSNDIYIDRTLEEIESYDKLINFKEKSIYTDINDQLFAKGSEKRNKIVKEAAKKSGNNKIVIEDINENRLIERKIDNEQNTLTRNPYLKMDVKNEKEYKNLEKEMEEDEEISRSSRSFFNKFIKDNITKNK